MAQTKQAAKKPASKTAAKTTKTRKKSPPPPPPKSPMPRVVGTVLCFFFGIFGIIGFFIAGAALGAWAATAVDVAVLRKPFGIYLLLSGVSLLWPRKQ